MKIDIVSPSKKILNTEDASGILLPSSLGYIEILENHCAMVSELGLGEVRIISGSHAGNTYFLSGGYVEVKDNHVTVIAEIVEERKDIDADRAEKAKKRAEERLASYKEEIDIARATASLERSMHRLKISRPN